MSKKAAPGGVAPNHYLPERASVAEATAWLKATTGQAWPLARLLETNIQVFVWYECADDLSPEVVLEVFRGDRTGLFTPIIGGGDLDYLKTVREHGRLSFVRRHDGKIVKLVPPARFTQDAIRFERAALEALAGLGLAPRPALACSDLESDQVVSTGRKLSVDDDRRIAAMFQADRNESSISREMGVTRQVVHRSLLRSGIKANKPKKRRP